MTVSLPESIADYFEASNSGRPEAVAKVFAADGVVRDEGGVHRGREAIAAWARATMDKYSMRITPLTASGTGVVVVKASVAGTFPGSPLELTFRFDLGEDGIRALAIGA